MKTQHPYTILLLLDATPQWLSLSREERGHFFEKTVLPIFQKFTTQVKVRLFDSEYFHAKVSDFLIIEAFELDQYRALIEYLRDTEIYTVPYFNVTDIIPGQENAYRDFEEHLRNEKTGE